MKLGELAEKFQYECRSDAGTEISGIARLQDATPDQLSFLFSAGYREALKTSQAAAIVLCEGDAGLTDKPVLIADNPRLAWARIAAVFDTAPATMPFIHPSAVISDQAALGRGVAIGAMAVIQPGARIGDGAVIGPGCHIGHGVSIGNGSRLAAGVVIYHEVRIGRNCIVHGNCVIGADGFGFDASGCSAGSRWCHDVRDHGRWS